MHGPLMILHVVHTRVNNGDTSSTCPSLWSAILGLKIKKSKKSKIPDFLTLVMMLMRVEAEERAHDRMEKAAGQQQVTEVIAHIVKEEEE